jgi:hypothetical protein
VFKQLNAFGRIDLLVFSDGQFDHIADPATSTVCNLHRRAAAR